MISSFARILSAGLILLLGSLVHAADRQIQATWEELPSQVLGRKISTVLTDSTLVEGRVVAVMPDTLVVKVSKTTAPTRFTGTANLPRELVSIVRVARLGWMGQAAGLLAGGASGAAVGAAIGGAKQNLDVAHDGAVIGSVVGVVAGWAIGYYTDRHTTVITIIK